MSPRIAGIALLLISLSCGSPVGSAQTERESKKEAVSVDQLAERLGKLEAAWLQQIEGFNKILAQELAAKRTSEREVQNLQWGLRNAASENFDVERIMEVVKVPLNNAALMTAFRDLETAVSKYKTERSEVVEAAISQLRKDISKSTLESTDPAEIDRLIAATERARQAMERRHFNSNLEDGQSLSIAGTYLGALRRLVEAEVSKNPSAIAKASEDVRSVQSYQNIFSESERRERLEKTLVPFQKVADESKAQLEAALEQRKSSAEVSLAFSKYEEAFDFLRKAKQYGPQVSDITPSYRAMVATLRIAESGDAELFRQRVEEARRAIKSTAGTQNEEKFERLITLWEREFAEAAAARAKAEMAELRDRIIAVKSAEEIDSITIGLRQPSASVRRSNVDNERTNQLLGALSSIANAWRTGTISFLQSDSSPNAASGGFGPEINTLKLRVEREILSQLLQLPELTKPPLTEKPIREAIETICDQMAQKREWRRLYQVLTFGEPRYVSPRGSADDTVTALRAFFTGQNFELAELWSDAADAYRTVLQSTSSRAPITDAAERLKIIKKEHPESIRPMSVPGSRSGLRFLPEE